MVTNGSSDVWVWDPLSETADFVHPGELPNDRQVAKTRLINGISGPFLAKITPVILAGYNQGQGIATVERDGGRMEEVPKSRVLPWCEGLLMLQALRASRREVQWFTRNLEHLLNVQLSTKMSGLCAHVYVQERLLNEAVTGAKYQDMNRTTHNFRRRGLLQKEIPKDPATQEEVLGFWKIEKIAGYMPPWEAYHEFGIYQDFYLIHWEHPFSDVDYSRTENGFCTLGATWEPDECLPPQLDRIRLREKLAWIQRRKDAEVRMVLEAKNGGRKRPRVSCHAETPVAKFCRRGQPLLRDLFRFKVGHDFHPEEVEDNIRQGWPKNAHEYPEGYGVAAPPGFCKQRCNCMDDGRVQDRWEMEKPWLEEPTRSRAVDAVIHNLSNQLPAFVRRRGQVTNQHRFETTQTLTYTTSRTMVNAVVRSMAEEVKTQIREAMQELPMHALFDRSDEVRIPMLAFQDLESDYCPLLFFLSPASAKHSHWLSVRPTDGLLIGKVQDAGEEETRQMIVEVLYPEAKKDSVQFTVKDAPPHWEHRTNKIMARVTELRVPNCPLWENFRAILEQPLNDLRSPKGNQFGKWLQSMEKLLRMLRSLPSANLVKDSANTGV